MKPMSSALFWTRFSCAALLLAGGGTALAAGTNELSAGEELAIPAATNEAVLPEGEDLPAATNGREAVASGASTNEVPSGDGISTNGAETVEEEPVTVPSKPAPVYRGSDMRNAFGGAGSSRFGVSGRVNTIARKPGKERPDGAWRRNLELGISTSQGNSETLRFDGSISGSKETEENTFFLKAGGRYGESDGEKDTENASGEAKIQHRLSGRMYAAVDGNIYHDAIADLSYRAQGSLSLGRHFIRTGRTALSAEIGPGYVAEKKGGEIEGFMAGRAAQYLEFLVTPTLQVWESVEFVPNLEDSAVYYVNAKVGLDTVLLADWSLRFAIEDRYDSQPAEDKEGNDLLTTTSLALDF